MAKRRPNRYPGFTVKANLWLIVSYLLMALLANTSAEQETAGQADTDLRLRIACLYDGNEGLKAHEHPIHRYLALPANYLGLRFDYYDITKGLPTAEQLESCRGILTWFADTEVPEATRYLLWLEKQLAEGKRVLIVGGLGAFTDAATQEAVAPALINRALSGLGLSWQGQFTDNALGLEIVTKTAAMAEFERSLEGEVAFFDGYRATTQAAKIYLQLRRRATDNMICDAIVVTERGGFVAPSYAIWNDPYPPYSAQWRIDPYRLLAEAFALGSLPRPDPTTLEGTRLFYSQIDGDAFESQSIATPGKLCAEVIYDRILAKYPLPVTVGLIAAPLDPMSLGRDKPEYRRIARKTFALQNVEPASHAFVHPFDWEEGVVGYQVDGYLYDPSIEVLRSVEVLNRHVMPEGKSVKIMLWSGDCNPPIEALEACRRLGIFNINGGESRLDAAFPSLTGLNPYCRKQGGLIQVHASMSNENVYTNQWHGPYDAFRHVVDTWEHTSSPRRTHPVHLYYHYYIGERRASLRSIQEALAWVNARDDLHPVFASRYCAAVEGFDAARLAQTQDGGFSIRGYGHMRTLRFDNEPRHVDLTRSDSVSGYYHAGTTLYVHLLPAERASVYLRNRPAQHPHLRLATVEVSAFATKGDGSIELRTLHAPWGRVVLAGLTPDSDWVVESATGERRLHTTTAGELEFNMPTSKTTQLFSETAVRIRKDQQ